MNVTQLQAWQLLAASVSRVTARPLADLLQDAERNEQLRLHIAGCQFDLTKQRVDGQVLGHLNALAEQTHIAAQRQRMLNGELINRSEQRAVLHSALRGGANAVAGVDQLVADGQMRMFDCAARIRSGQWRGGSGKAITDVVHIGIGGSHLGPELVVEALGDCANSHLRLHFLANIDANNLHRVLGHLNPETTLFIVASKSFATLETAQNAHSARAWYIERTNTPQHLSRHFLGVTTNIQAAVDFGLDEANLFPLWDWVGGRYSLWSAVGLPILLAIGEAQFQQFLAGARCVDEHFASQPTMGNVPMLNALLATWNYNFLGTDSLAVLAYDERLRLLPDYLQQLELESNGKSVNVDGNAVDYHTMPLLWGGVGTNGQHAYHQWLHQGTRAFAADFVIVAADDRQMREHHNWLLANALGQSQALAVGAGGGIDGGVDGGIDGGVDGTPAEPHRRVAGNHPTTTIVMDQLGPQELGGLLAVYEHKVFCQGIIWNINSFDQWGVELGKELAIPIYEQLAGNNSAPPQEPATQGLIDYIKSHQIESHQIKSDH